MAKVFVSYQNTDREKVRLLVEALRAEGLDAWWDQDIAVGAVWADAIGAALTDAKAVVVCWSPAAVESENVREEARRARSRGLLVQAFIEDCEPPLFFGEQQGARLVSWDGARSNDRFRMLVKGLRALTLGGPLPAQLRKQIGYKKRDSVAGPLGLVALAMIVAACASLLFIEDIRSRIFPQPATKWSMSAGVRADIRPLRSPLTSSSERVASSTVIAMSPVFVPNQPPRAPASVTDVRLELDIPGHAPVRYAWLYFSSNDEDLKVYIDRVGDAGPFPLDEASAREITFEPTSAFKWIDFVQALTSAFVSGERFFVLRVSATIAAEGQADQLLTNECPLPIEPVLEHIQRTGFELNWVSIPCGFPAPQPVAVQPEAPPPASEPVAPPPALESEAPTPAFEPAPPSSIAEADDPSLGTIQTQAASDEEPATRLKVVCAPPSNIDGRQACDVVEVPDVGPQ